MELGEVYFWTSTIYQWKHLLRPRKYKQVIIESMANLCAREKIRVYAFVILDNHLHMLWEMLAMNGKEMPHASFQKFTAQAIQKDLRNCHPEVLKFFHVDEKERSYRFWQRDPLAVQVNNKAMAEQTLDYIHLNPLQSHWNLAKSPEDYLYSSASYYEKGTNDFEFLSHYTERF